MRRGTVQASRPGDRDQREARVSAVFLSDPSGGETQPRSRAALRTHPSVRPWAEPLSSAQTHSHGSHSAHTHARAHFDLYFTLLLYCVDAQYISNKTKLVCQVLWQYHGIYIYIYIYLYIGPSFDVNTMVWLWLFCNYSVFQSIMIFSSYSYSFATVLGQWMKLFKSIAI